MTPARYQPHTASGRENPIPIGDPRCHHPPLRRRSTVPREVPVVARRGPVDEPDVVGEADILRLAEVDQVVVDDLAQ